MKEVPWEDSGDFLMRKVEQALAMSLEERFRAGGELFEFACESARAGILGTLQDPDPTVVEIRLRERLEMAELLEQKIPH